MKAKHLLSGVAVIAALALSAPAWAQASDTTSAMPPKHHAHTRSDGKVASHHPSRFPNVQGDNSANQLNQAELGRLQTGSAMPPPAPMSSPSMQPPTQGGNSMGMQGPNTGGPGLTPYSTGAPPR
jgi:hypothetical protein